MNIRSFFYTSLSLIVFLLGNLSAQVPQLINYQGRVAVAGVNFAGAGQFKFALVNAAGTTTYWSNDGSSSAGAEPTASVALTVSKGLYSVLLGDATLTNMTAVPSTAFQNTEVYLRVWFNDGANGSQLLSPDQRIAAVGYAMIASEALAVPEGAITSAKIASGAVESDNFAAGAVGSDQLASGAAQANLEASGQSGVGSGGVVLSATINHALQAAGYVRVGTAMTGDFWEEHTSVSAPSARFLHTGVWTGSEMLIWGGYDGSYFNDTFIYTPSKKMYLYQRP